MKLKKTILYSCVFIFLFSCILVFPTFAQENPTPVFDNPISLQGNESNTIIFANLTGNIIAKILALVGVIALLLIIYAGFMWMTARGDSGKIKTSQQIIVWATIGILIIFSSYTLLRFVFKIIPA